MTQKTDPAANSQDEPQSPLNVQPSVTETGTAPEVPRAIAKQYGLHKEPLHQSAKPAVAGPGKPTENQPKAPADAVIDNPETDAAVDDIVSKESDELLQLADDTAGTAAPPPKGFGARLKGFFKAWWRNKVARYITISVLALGLMALAIVPTTRYGLLNFAGVRSSASVVVLDDATQLPLKNVLVSLNDRTVQTNREGIATVKGLKLGNYQLRVKRIAFAAHSQQVTIGWGSNPLGDVRLRAVGTRYQIEVKDYVSGKPISGAEAESDQVNALSDDDGKITLTVEDTNITKLDITLHAPGYRSEALVLDAATETLVPVVLVPARKTAYVSKASGKYDVYSSYIDGRDKKVLLTGSGLENSNLSLVLSPNGQQAALVSTRDNLRDRDNYLLYGLTFINVNDGTHTTVDHAQQIQLVDWIGDRLVYRLTVAGASGANPQRNRLIAYNFGSNARIQLANANQFNTILSANGYVYYAASATDPGATLGLFRVKPDNSGRERLVSQEVWTGLRTDLNTLSLQTPGGWLRYDLATKKAQPAPTPASLASIAFVTQGNHTAWTEIREGKGTLLASDGGNVPRPVAAQPGLTNPVYWLTDKVLVYRVVTASEAADFVASTDGGTPRKLHDVVASHGYVQAY